MITDLTNPISRMRIAVFLGTRPEAIKMAPVIERLRRQPGFDTLVVSTGQHREMLDQALSMFEITPDIDLNLMQPSQDLAQLTGRVLEATTGVLHRTTPDLVMVQGDTTTAFAAALAASYARVPVAHVEAGLRSHDDANPFPEEINRRLAGVLSRLHFAPTSHARRQLLNEGVAPQRVVVTGNTIVDALSRVLDLPFDFEETPLAGILRDDRRILLVTSHRRESWGHDLEEICMALRCLAARFPDLQVVYPVHLNPNVRHTVNAYLGNVEGISLVPPLDYRTFVQLMRRSYLILTDSGGIQEEAPTLQKPLLVLRKLTERPEAFELGLSKVIGTTREAIVNEASHLLTNQEAYQSMIHFNNPFGDGRASERIAQALVNWFRGRARLLKPQEEFQGVLPMEMVSCSVM